MATKQQLAMRYTQAAALAATWLGCAMSAVASELPESKAGISSNRHIIVQHDVYLDDEAWITDIGTLLYADPDTDGYFSGLSLSIDADTAYSSYEVYAVIDIINASSTSQPATGDLPPAERLHTTRVFDLYGRSATDEYRVDIDLVQNYSPDIYDLQISLLDAYDGRVLDQVGSNDFRNLRALSLESEEFQDIHTPVVDRPVDAPNDDIRVTEYAGSTGFGMVSLIFMSLLFRIRSRRDRNSTPRV